MRGIEDIVMNKFEDWRLEGNPMANVALLHPMDYNDLSNYLYRNGCFPNTETGDFFFNGMQLISSFSEKQGVPRVGIVA